MFIDQHDAIRTDDTEVGKTYRYRWIQMNSVLNDHSTYLCQKISILMLETCYRHNICDDVLLPK